MAYCIQDDILRLIDETSLIQLTDDAGAGEIDDDKVTRAIADADAAIDAYCQDRYSVPLSPVPPRVRQLSVDIAVYNLYSRSDLSMPEVRKDRNKEAIRFLEKVAEGKIKLGAATPAPANTDNTVNIDYNDRVFSRNNMSGF